MSRDTGRVISVVGPSDYNKGDQLMCAAIEEWAGDSFGVAFHQRSPRVLFRYINGVTRRLPPAWGARGWKYSAAALLPKAMRDGIGQSTYRDFTAVFDCSGFGYSDQWLETTRNAVWRRRHYARSLRRGAPVVFLPQALGPFETSLAREYVRPLLEMATRVYPRDGISYQHVLDLGIEASKVRRCPDISIALAPPVPLERFGDLSSTVAIVPNKRMVDKGTSDPSEYARFLLHVIQRVFESNLRPSIVIQQLGDLLLAEEIQSRLGRSVEIVNLPALTTKSYLGQCLGLVGSRFHSLVSGMSLTVPAIGTSWTHKYRELFAEFNSDKFLVRDLSDLAEVDLLLEELVDRTANQQRRKILHHATIELRKDVEAMWDEVSEILGQG